MAARKPKKVSAAAATITESQFTVVLEDLRAQFNVFGEALQGLREHMDARFKQVDERFDRMERRLDEMDKRFEQVDKRFEQVDKRFEQVDGRLEAVQVEVKGLRHAVEGVEGRQQSIQDEMKNVITVVVRLEAKTSDHDTRITKLEGAA